MSTHTTDLISLRTLLDTPAVSGAINGIIEQLRDAQAGITEARPPIAELTGGYRQTLERHAAIKGRAAIYPYVGSGLGNGPLVQLADGSVKWDMINGIGVFMFGHSDPDLTAVALRAALGDTIMQGNLQFDESLVDFGELLVTEARQSSRLAHCFVINSGALANESCLKVCLQHNAPADRVLAFDACFAGRTMATVQIGDSAAGRVGLPLDLDVDYVPFHDADRPEASSAEALRTLRRHLERYPGRHACFVMELVQGEGGFNVAPRDFFVPMLELCREHGIGVWFDEIQTFGRMPELFAFQHLALGDYADVVSVGKLSQVCGCLMTEDYNPKPGLLSATFAGSTVGLRVGHRMISRLINEGAFGPNGRIVRLQASFRQHMQSLLERHPDFFPLLECPDGSRSDRLYDGIGGMCRFTPFGGRKEKINEALHALFDEGVIAFLCGRGPHHIRFLPPVGVMEPAHFTPVFEILERALAKVG